jgi:hypothetical protein
VFDTVMWVFVGVFAVSSILYFVHARAQQHTSSKRVDVKVETGRVTDSTLYGAKTKGQAQDAKVTVRTKDIKGSEVSGYEERDK